VKFDFLMHTNQFPIDSIAAREFMESLVIEKLGWLFIARWQDY